MLMQTYITRMNIYLYLIADDPAIFCSFIQLLKQNKTDLSTVPEHHHPDTETQPMFPFKTLSFLLLLNLRH